MWLLMPFAIMYISHTYILWRLDREEGTNAVLEDRNYELEKTIERMKISESNLRDRELQLLEIIKYLQSNKNIGNKN